MCVICEHNSYYMSWMFKCMRNYEGRNGNNVSVSYYEHLDFVLQTNSCCYAVCTFYLLSFRAKKKPSENVNVMANGIKIIIPYRRWENVKSKARFQFWVQEYALHATDLIWNVSFKVTRNQTLQRNYVAKEFWCAELNHTKTLAFKKMA